MRILYFQIILLLLITSCSEKTNKETREKLNDVPSDVKKIVTSPLDSFYNPNQFPFYHGVASGDPLQNAVIIWTRVTPKLVEDIEVQWEMALDSNFQNIIQKGKTITTIERDFTVKIDVQKLDPGKIYYYQFKSLGKKSPVGRTQTLPEKTDQLRLGFASCSNYAWGYFNAYRLMGNDSLDAVIHLGDYIYEHEPGVYEGKISGRTHIPDHEILSLEDYRTRYAQYRLDEDLKYVHAKHPFITIWDDHELANNAYKEGAQNHNENEGDWKERLAIAKKVYYEWMPIRESENHYRAFSFGDLANLIMIDTRTDERTKQPESVEPDKFDTSAHIISNSQMAWLSSELQKNHTWRVIGNQILFSDVNIFFGKSPHLYTDGWSAYRTDQQTLKTLLKNAKRTLVVTGDFHSSFIIKEKSYWEFIVPSISSANYDEDNSLDSALIYEKWYIENNPNLRYTNLRNHGYFVLELTQAACFGQFIYSKDIKTRNQEKIVETKFGFRGFAFMDEK